MKSTKSLIKKLFFNFGYICLIMLCMIQVGHTKKITTYNIAGISSMKSMHLEYNEPDPIPELPTHPQTLPTFTEANVYKYRLTSYYEDDCVGAGFCRWDLVPNEYGWYTYNGKLVVAGATYYMQNVFGVKENKLYFTYWDELVITIDGVDYEAIILDTCGACYRDERLDLMVVDQASGIDRGYRGYNMIDVRVTKKQ